MRRIRQTLRHGYRTAKWWLDPHCDLSIPAMIRFVLEELWWAWSMKLGGRLLKEDP